MDFAESLNHGCICRTLDAQQLREQLENHPGLTGLMKNLTQTRPNLFSSTAVFVACRTVEDIVLRSDDPGDFK